jgi:hypothetical protein
MFSEEQIIVVLREQSGGKTANVSRRARDERRGFSNVRQVPIHKVSPVKRAG